LLVGELSLIFLLIFLDGFLKFINFFSQACQLLVAVVLRRRHENPGSCCS
jgi:hypothetical protein